MDLVEENEFTKMKRGLSWVEVKESLNTDGCPVCNTMSRSINKYFEFLLYEYALDASVHKKTLASFGMCNTHTYLLKEAEEKLKSDGLNISVLYETLFQKEEKLLAKVEEKEFEEKKKLFAGFRKRRDFTAYKKEILIDLVGKGICPGYQHQKESESFYTHEIIRLCRDEEFRSKFESDKILLCRRHFLFIINEAEETQPLKYLITEQKKKIHLLHRQLSGFIEKHDYRLKSGVTDDEKKSWEKALEYFGSKKNINRDGYNDLLIQ